MRGAARAVGLVARLSALVAGGGYLVLAALPLLGMTTGFARSDPQLVDGSAERALFTVLVVLVWGTVVGAGLSKLWWMLRHSHRLSRWIDLVGAGPSPQLAAAVQDAGIRCPVIEIEEHAAYACAYGFWRPRIVVSSGLVQAAGAAELCAVLHHENHHVRCRDPLRVLVFRTAAAAFLLVPMVGAVLRWMLARRELAADRAAIARCGVAPVAGALLKATGVPAGNPGAALAALAGPALLEVRVVQLETGLAPRFLPTMARRTVVHSCLGVVAITGYFLMLYRVCMVAAACCL